MSSKGRKNSIGKCPFCYKDVEIRRYKGRFEIHNIEPFGSHDCQQERMELTISRVLSNVRDTVTQILDTALKENASKYGASNDLWQKNYQKAKEQKSA